MDAESLRFARANIADIENVIRSEAEIFNREEDISILLEPAIVIITQRHLDLIVKEIIDNSLKYSSLQTPIEIRGDIRESNYELTIKDHGHGITEEQIAGIDAFVQFNKRSFSQGENGLGLATVKRLCEIYCCKLSIESKVNEYTKVIIQIKRKSY